MMKDFIRHDRTQEPLPGNVDNVRFFLLSISASVRWNAWLERIEIKSGDFSSKLSDDWPYWSEWTVFDDTTLATLRTFASRTGCNFRPAKDFLFDCVSSLARMNNVDPAIDRLVELERAWDGVPRLDSWLARACHVSDDLYHAAVARNIVGGMVRRIREPGCKHDECALFISPEGFSKSSLAMLLAINPAWFTDATAMTAESKELILDLAGKCVIEFSEMNGGQKSVTHIKAMLSRTEDRGRTAYARSVSERKRRNIFIGSTNEGQALASTTGNRRFLPVRLNREIDIKWMKANVDQIIGEAAVRHAAGESFSIPRHLWSTAGEHQEGARARRPFEIHLDEWFGGDDRLHVYITAGDLQECVASIDSRIGTAYTERMRALGFTDGKKHVPGKGTVAVWCRGEKNGATRLFTRTDGKITRPMLMPTPTGVAAPVPVPHQ